MDYQVWIEHYKASTLEEKEELDPDEMCFLHVIQEPTETHMSKSDFTNDLTSLTFSILSLTFLGQISSMTVVTLIL